MAKEYSRVQRVSDHIQRELALIIQRELKDPRLLMVSINGVRVSRDLSYADIYVSFITEDVIENGMEALKKAAGFMRFKLGQALKLRIVPQLRFFYDDTISQGHKMSQLIDRARASDPDQNSPTDGHQT